MQFKGFNMSIGSNLKRLRRDKKMTQGDLANACGIRLGHISKIERDATDPKLSSIYALIKALDCTPNDLLADTEKMGVDSVLEMALARLKHLTKEQDKKIILRVIDNYCTAVAMQEIAGKRTILGEGIIYGKTPEMSSGEINDL